MQTWRIYESDRVASSSDIAGGMENISREVRAEDDEISPLNAYLMREVAFLKEPFHTMELP